MHRVTGFVVRGSVGIIKAALELEELVNPE